MSEQHNLKFHLPGLLKLLGKHLYSSPAVALRELIQNAHDSIQRRRLEDPSLASNYQPLIDISGDVLSRTLTIRDNGSGLTKEEIHTYLSTVGRSYTDEMRQRLDSGNSPDSHEFIGQFGLGLLAAFSVASRIEILTHSFKTGHPAWRWVFDGGQHYTLTIDERLEPGTTVVLHLKLDGEFLLNPSLRADLVGKYAGLLDVPITMDGASSPVNPSRAPWDIQPTDLERYAAFIDEHFGEPDILTLVSLRSVTGNSVAPTPLLQGVLYIPADAEISTREYGDVRVYVRGMFITESERNLLPRWARFVRGAIESPDLRPTASREQIRQDEQFYAIRQAIEEQLLDHFSYLAKHKPKLWKNIVYEHNDLIKAWALEESVLFEAVANIVVFDTTRGRMSLPDYLNETQGTIYYLVEDIGATQQALLFEAQGLVAVNASRFAEADFLLRYVQQYPDIDLVHLEPGVDFIFGTVPETSLAEWEPIVRYFTDQSISVELTRFNPVSIPAVLVFGAGSDTISRARRALEDEEVSGAVARMLSEYVGLRDPDKSAEQGVLHINIDNRLMQRLLHEVDNNVRFTAVLEVLYHNARFFSGKSLTADSARLSFDMITFSVEQLLRDSDGD